MPDEIRWTIMRRKIKLPTDFPPELSIRLAQNSNELKAAYSILQESYENEGLTQPNNSGMRVLKQFMMPSTATIVVLWKNEVIGTVSLIRDNPFGLPLDKIFNLEKFRKRNLHLAEVSSLAMSPKFRSKHGQLLFPLFKAVYQFGKDVLMVDALVIAVNPRWRDFYSGLYGFKNLESQIVENYDFVNGAPAIGLVFEYDPAYHELKKTYKNAKQQQNIFKQLWESNYSCISLPKRDYYSTVIRHINEKNFNEFFLKDESEFSKLSAHDQLILKRSLAIQESGLLPELESVFDVNPRKSYRFTTNLKSQTNFAKVKIHNVSREGLCFEVNKEFKITEGQNLELEIQVSHTQKTKVIIQTLYRLSDKNIWGAKVCSNDQSWQDFIGYQEQQLGIAKHKKSKNAA